MSALATGSLVKGKRDITRSTSSVRLLIGAGVAVAKHIYTISCEINNVVQHVLFALPCSNEETQVVSWTRQMALTESHSYGSSIEGTSLRTTLWFEGFFVAPCWMNNITWSKGLSQEFRLGSLVLLRQELLSHWTYHSQWATWRSREKNWREKGGDLGGDFVSWCSCAFRTLDLCVLVLDKHFESFWRSSDPQHAFSIVPWCLFWKKTST